MPALLKLAEAATGKKPQTVGIIQDNTAASVAFAKPMREGGLQKLGLKLVVDETFTPPLSDCTQLIQRVRSARPEILLLLPTAISDDKLCLEKLHELGLGRGRIPVVSNGAHIAAPDMLKNMSKDLLEGVMTVVGNWSIKGQETIMKEFVTKTNEPWITQELLSTYGDMWIFKEALETGRRGGPQEGCRSNSRDGHARGSGKIFSRRPGQVRRERPTRRRRSRHRAVAERPAGNSLSGQLGDGQADLAEAVDDDHATNGHPAFLIAQTRHVSRASGARIAAQRRAPHRLQTNCMCASRARDTLLRPARVARLGERAALGGLANADVECERRDDLRNLCDPLCAP